MERSYKFRIYPNSAQENLIQRTFGCCRFVYNYYLNQKIEQHRATGKAPTRFQQDKDLTVLKTQFEWLKEVDSQALKASIRDLDAAFQNFFRGIKQRQKIGYPKFKSKKEHWKSYKAKQSIYFNENAIHLPKLGFVKCKVSKEIQGRILFATVQQRPSGKYYVAVCCTDIDVLPLGKTGKSVGIDISTKDLAVTSDAVRYAKPKHYDKSIKKLVRLQHQLSRKSKGSNNSEKARVKVARLQEHITNQQNDTLHKLTTELVREYDVICIKHLISKETMMDHKIARMASYTLFGELRRQLEYKSQWYEKKIVTVAPYYLTSQICSKCGHLNAGVENPDDSNWICSKCGTTHSNEVNTAQNILNEGMRCLA